MKRWIVFTVLIFALLSSIPVVDSGYTTGWLQVWAAYPAFFTCLCEEGWLMNITLISLAIIIVHIGLSVALGIGLDRLARRLDAKRRSNVDCH